MKPEQETLQQVLNELLHIKRNAKMRTLFLAATEGLKPKNCSVKIGWKSGTAINFHFKFAKGGTETVFSAIEKGIENANEIKYFIYGLNPKIFQFHPELCFDEIEPGYFFLSFTLLRDAKAKRKKKVR